MTVSSEAYVIEAVRTAVGKRNGSLAGVHPVDLGAAAWRGLFDRVDVDPGAVDDVIAGCVDAIGPQQATSPGCHGWPPDIQRKCPVSLWTVSAVPASKLFPLAHRRFCPVLPI
jgi:hypothetical protein